MKKSNFFRIITFICILALLVPVLIYGSKRISGQLNNDPHVKLPPKISSSPETSPRVLTQRERDKLYLVDRTYFQAPDLQQVPEEKATISSSGEYTGITPRELEKLKHAPRIKTVSKSLKNIKPRSTIEIVPRPAGADGLTDAEKAKLEAWKKYKENASHRDRSE